MPKSYNSSSGYEVFDMEIASESYSDAFDKFYKQESNDYKLEIEESKEVDKGSNNHSNNSSDDSFKKISCVTESEDLELKKREIVSSIRNNYKFDSCSKILDLQKTHQKNKSDC